MPTIQYFLAPDKARIAYWHLGELDNPLLVLPSFPRSHLEREWEILQLRAFYQSIAKHRGVVRMDWRGTGLSQRVAMDASITTQAQDIHSLVEAMKLPKLAIFASFSAGPIAMEYALAYPETLSALLLWHSFARPNDYLHSSRLASLMAMAESDWDFFLEAGTLNRIGWSNKEVARQFVDLTRSSHSQEYSIKARQALEAVDLTSRLPDLETPTLVLHRRAYEGLDLDISANLAAGLPNARLSILPGSAGDFSIEDSEEVIRVTLEFLGDSDSLPEITQSNGRLTRRERQILRMVATGLRDKEIAAELGLATSTVHRHVANLYRKIDARNRAEATAFAIHEGVVS